jgi:hypothetical protein
MDVFLTGNSVDVDWLYLSALNLKVRLRLQVFRVNFPRIACLEPLADLLLLLNTCHNLIFGYQSKLHGFGLHECVLRDENPTLNE